VAGQANLYGGWLAMMVLGTICFCFSPVPRGKTRLWLAVTAVMGSVALLYTLSRGAWLALAMALAVVAVLRNRRILFLGTLIVIFLPALASQAVRDRAASILEIIDSIDEGPEDPFNETEEDVSAMVRVQQWQALPGMFAEAPIFGHGYAYFPELWQETGHKKKAAHSSIIEITTELGLFGLLGYAALVFPMILLGWLNSRPDLPPLDRTLGTAAFGIGLCLILLDTSGTRFRNSEVMANFWILAGMMVAVRNARSISTQARHAPPVVAKRLAQPLGQRHRRA
jgi:O-antigen ligase